MTDAYARELAERGAREERLRAIVAGARAATEPAVAAAAGAEVWSHHPGAIGIDPALLYVWFVVPDEARALALRGSDAWGRIAAALRARIAAGGYPDVELRAPWVGLVSQEACDRDAGGNWYHFFK